MNAPFLSQPALGLRSYLLPTPTQHVVWNLYRHLNQSAINLLACNQGVSLRFAVNEVLAIEAVITTVTVLETALWVTRNVPTVLPAAITTV